MKLRVAEIKNYRSIKNVTVELKPNCRVLIGVNESGKSNILRALSFLTPNKKPVRKDDVRESLPDEDNIQEALERPQ